ncbi:MAG: 2-C-methyl-D-erythritol 4-phosphate cytidylyltransferase, partial [Bacteroidota bacterium]
MKKYALIVAGGSGSRMQREIPKQFIRIGAYPILMHTLSRFYHSVPGIQIVLVLPASSFPHWDHLREEYAFDIPHQLVEGGGSRPESVRNGLRALSDEESLVAIHDGVRPFVSSEIILESFAVAMEKGSAIAAVALKDSLREMVAGGSEARDRAQYRLIQTPQTFKLQLIKQAYQREGLENFTDDASIAEAS